MNEKSSEHSVRAQFGEKASYSAFNREERNLVAILFHVLNLGTNLSTFLENVGCEMNCKPDSSELFVEWAYLRDLWNRHQDPAKRRKVVLKSISPSGAYDFLASASFEQFNAFFGAPSKITIQSPGRWSLLRMAEHIADDQEFLRACRFKWAFNIKPDLVIQCGVQRALCIEAKLESKEAFYPTSAEERRAFQKRGLARVAQTELQRHMMEDLLGIDTDFRFLVARIPLAQTTPPSVTWREAFHGLDIAACPTYIRKWIANL